MDSGRVPHVGFGVSPKQSLRGAQAASLRSPQRITRAARIVARFCETPSSRFGG